MVSPRAGPPESGSRQPPETESSAWATTAADASLSSWESNHPSGRATRWGEPALGRLTRPRLVKVQRVDQVIERGHGVDQRKPPTNVGPRGESLEIPSDVLAEVATSCLL